MPLTYDSTISNFIYLPSLKGFFSGETGRSNFLETILQIIDASGYRHSFDNDQLSCIYVSNRPYSPLFLVAEHKFIDGKVVFRLFDFRMPKYRALVTREGFPLSVTLQGHNNEFTRYNGLVLEQDYGGAYTGKVDHIDLLGLVEGLTHLDRWRAALLDAGYAAAAGNPANVTFTNNRYVFEQEFKSMF